MENKVTARNPITEGCIWKGMLLFALPIMLGSLLQQLYNTADAVIVGRALGKAALASVGGSSARISNLLVNAFVALSSGASVIVAQHFGARDTQRVRRSICTAMLLSVVCGILLMVLGITSARQLLEWMQTTPETLDASASYLRIFFLGMVPTMLYNMGSGILRAMGDSKRPLYYLFVCVVANIALDLLFVIVFQWGIEGAAAATALSQVACAALVVRALRRLPEEQRLLYDREELDRGILRRMLHVGIPAALQSSMYGIANIVLQVGINMLGTDSMAGWTAFNKFDDYYWPISNAIGIAVMTYVGQNFGAGDRERVHESIHKGLLIHLTTSALFSVIIFSGRYPMMHLFVGDDPTVIAIGAQVTALGMLLRGTPAAPQERGCKQNGPDGPFNGSPSHRSPPFPLHRLQPAPLSYPPQNNRPHNRGSRSLPRRVHVWRTSRGRPSAGWPAGRDGSCPTSAEPPRPP